MQSQPDRRDLVRQYALATSDLQRLLIKSQLDGLDLSGISATLAALPPKTDASARAKILTDIVPCVLRLEPANRSIAISAIAASGLATTTTIKSQLSAMELPPEKPTETKTDPRNFFDGSRFQPAVLARHLSTCDNYAGTPIDQSGLPVQLLCERGGVYRPGEAIARTRINAALGDRHATPSRIEDTLKMLAQIAMREFSTMNPEAGKLINLANGMLDWSSGSMYPHDPKYLSTIQLPVTFDPDASSDLLDRFLSEVFPPDALGLAEEIVGYLMLPITTYQMAFMLVGSGANGKSTFLSMLEAFIGKENVSNISLQDLVRSTFSAAELDGKLVNLYGDIPSTALEQSDIFKAIVSGDTIKAERKYGQPFKLHPTARLIFSANERPIARDNTKAYFRRWCIIRFPNTFGPGKADPDLVAKLTAPEVLSALLNRALKGLARITANRGFAIPESVRNEREDYRKQSNSAYSFISTNVISKPGASYGKTALYNNYTSWCHLNGIKMPFSVRRFNENMIEAFPGIRETKHTHGGERLWAAVDYQPESGAQEGPEPAFFDPNLDYAE